MIWSDLKKCNIEDIVGYINEKLIEYGSLKKLADNLSINESTIRKYVKSKGYERVENQFVLSEYKCNHQEHTQEKGQIIIENTGVTIDEKYLSEIFKPFFRIEKSRSRKTGGSGLGLYLVSQIFKSHGFNHSLKNKENSVIFIIEF